MAASPKTFSLRGASQYLATKGVEVSELRMRTLVHQHEIFVNDPNTQKTTTREDSATKQWFVSQKALDEYAKAAEKGTVRATNGAKAYKISVTAEQLASLREWAKANGVAEPDRANKSYVKKTKPATDGAIGSDIEQALGSDDEDGDDDGLFAETEADEVEA